MKVYLVRPLGNIPLAAEGEYGVAACDCPPTAPNMTVVR